MPRATDDEVWAFIERVARAAPILPTEEKWLDNDILIRELSRQARLLLRGSLDDPQEVERHEKRLANLAKAHAARKAKSVREVDRDSTRTQSNDPGADSSF